MDTQKSDQEKYIPVSHVSAMLNILQRRESVFFSQVNAYHAMCLRLDKGSPAINLYCIALDVKFCLYMLQQRLLLQHASFN